jgi:hypothetical protein
VLRRRAAGVLLSVLAGLTPAFADYREVTVSAGGTIRGQVRLAGSAPKLAPMPTGKDEAVCGKEQPTPRLVQGKGGGIANAVVYLETIASGKPFVQQPAVIDQRGCRYEPHVLVVPVVPALGITNSDTVLHNVHACSSDAQRRTLFNIAQPLIGQHTPVGADKLSTPGFYALSCEAGHPWMSGYLVVAAHPYYALTAADGSFSLDDVPPGTYSVRMWHEGVHVRSYSASLQRYEFEEPYEAAQTVQVRAGAEGRADFSITLRPAPAPAATPARAR